MGRYVENLFSCVLVQPEFVMRKILDITGEAGMHFRA